MNTKEFLLEIGTEEIPAAALNDAVEDLKRLATDAFNTNMIDVKGVESFGTPRRLVLYVESMAQAQEDRVIEKRGPAKSAAYDADGNPTRAALGFVKGQGVEMSDVTILKTDKGEYLNVSKKIPGEKTLDVLSEIIPKLIFSIPFKKSMRWSDGTIRFSRPIHSILALFGGDIVKFSIGDFSSGTLKSSDLSFGHRFLSPSKFKVKDYKHYCEELKKRFVIVDAAKRKSMIDKDIQKIEKVMGLDVIKDDELLTHVANLVEYPVTANGSFDERFLELPKEVLINSMKVHQKYFAANKKGEDELTNVFVNVLNTRPNDIKVVVKGNERVLRARLSDAEFFYNEDKKRSLDSCNERLGGVIFQKKLGTMHEKVERVKNNAEFIAASLANGSTKAALRAAELCKADLVTSMVGEFPKLQGIMGREYARLAKEDEAVCEAIYEHYLPTGADGTLPKSDVGAVVSIADKIDTLVACFSVGLIPTGSADPFALRRQTLGIINILLYNDNDISLISLTKNAFANIKDKAKRSEDETIDDVMNFFCGRFKNMLTPDPFPYDVVDSVISIGLDNLKVAQKKISALSEFKERPDFEALSVSFKRVANIVKSVDGDLSVDTALFADESEKELHNKFNRVKSSVDELCSKGEYLAALEATTKLKGSIDDFFDNVLVMDKDEAIKNNRLGLLKSIEKIFLNIADFSKIN